MTVKPFTVGQEVQTTIGLLTLDERVIYDPSAYQTETGWWALDGDGKDYFISDDGTVYANGDTEDYNTVIGRVVS